MHWRPVLSRLTGVLLALTLLLAGCQPGGNQGSLSPPDSPSAPVEQQAIERLLALYREAVLAEDIDRLQALLQPAPALAQAAAQPAARQTADGTFADLTVFRQALSATFVTQAVTALGLPAAEVVIAPDCGSVTFLEVESTLDTASLTQYTRLFRTTWQLQRTTAGDTVTFRIGAVQRHGPLVQITTPGQVQAGALTRVSVTIPSAGFGLTQVEIEATSPQTGQPLQSTARGFHGTFRATPDTPSALLQVRLHRASGAALVLAHAYQVQGESEGVVQPVAGTEATPVRAVAVALDGTIWAGGD
jgi:hypothetical protein